MRPATEAHGVDLKAIADPQGHLPNLGAESEYAPDETWQNVVTNMLDECQAVILLEGATEGLLWELTHVRRHCKPHSVMLASLPTSFRRGKDSWRRFSHLLTEAGFTNTDDPGPGAVISFDPSWSPVPLIRDAVSCEDVVGCMLNWSGGRH